MIYDLSGNVLRCSVKFLMPEVCGDAVWSWVVSKISFSSIKALRGLLFLSSSVVFPFSFSGLGVAYFFPSIPLFPFLLFPLCISFIDYAFDIEQFQIVLDLDETLICAYETSSLPGVIRSQAIEAGLKCFELECVSSDKVISFPVTLCVIWFSLGFSKSKTISLVYAATWRTVKGSLRSTMLLSSSVRVCAISYTN